MATISTPESFQFPVLQWDPVKRLWRVMEDYVFIWKVGGIDQKFTIPTGTEYDKASVPRPLWGIARTDGPFEASSLLHDTAYRYCQHGGVFPPGMYQRKTPRGLWVSISRISRAEADELLRYASVCGGAPAWEAFEYKWAVKLAPENWLKGF